MNANALSKYLLSPVENAEVLDGVVANVNANDLSSLQQQDQELKEIIGFLKNGTLPTDETKARVLALTQLQYVLDSSVLYCVVGDETLRTIPPLAAREELFKQAHAGAFGGHLRDAKVFSQLQCHYWWRGMQTDATKWSRECLTWSTYTTGRPVRPPLTLILVAGLFDHMGVDVVQLPLSSRGNRYAVVFVDYLTKWPEVFAVQDQTARIVGFFFSISSTNNFKIVG